MTGVPSLHIVTDDAVLAAPGFRDRARAVVDAGGAHIAFHVRGPTTSARSLYAWVEELRPWCDRTGALLVVNDRVDIALAAGLRGVHVGVRSLSVADARSVLGDSIGVGASIHTGPEAGAAAAAGAAWLFVGTLYATPSHRGRPGRGGQALREAAEAAPGTPLLGIGGVSVERTEMAMEAGAHGVAVIRGVWESPDPAKAVGDYLQALSQVS